MIEVQALDPFKILYKLPSGINIIVAIGGRGGAKTYEVSKYIAFSATIKKKRCVVLRDEKELVRESILNEVLLRYDTANESGALSAHYDRLDTGIKERKTGEMLVFTKGFRASDSQKKANLKSISNIDIAVVEEAEDIRDEEKFNTFADSIRKEGSLIIIILNTPDIQHWIIKRYFNMKPVVINGQVKDGYFDISPKQIKGFLCIQTSFEDNPYLPTHIIDNYRGYGNPESHLFNEFYYLTAIKGYASTGRKGQILTKVKPIKLAEYMKLPFKEYYGQDFGTASPAGTIGVKFDKNRVYARQLNYKPLSTLDIARMYCSMRLTDSDEIIADSAEPKSISKLKNGYRGEELATEDFIKYPRLAVGFNVKAADKGQDSVRNGLDLLQSLDLYVVEESTDFWNEVYNYIWEVDKNGNPTGEPIDEFNHLIDPWRYVVQKHKKGYKVYE
jgi:PBSX family phage terminase large subunit